MRGLQGIITHRSSSCESNVNDGGPAFQFVVAIAMEKIRGANGNAGGGGFDNGEAGVIIDDIVGQKYFLTPAPPHIQCGEIVQSTCGGNASEQQIVFLVPKVMLNWQAGGLRGFFLPSLPVSVL